MSYKYCIYLVNDKKIEFNRSYEASYHRDFLELLNESLASKELIYLHDEIKHVIPAKSVLYYTHTEI